MADKAMQFAEKQEEKRKDADLREGQKVIAPKPRRFRKRSDRRKVYERGGKR